MHFYFPPGTAYAEIFSGNERRNENKITSNTGSVIDAIERSHILGVLK